MGTDLEKFLLAYFAFSKQELDEISSRFQFKKIRKNDFVFRSGEVCRHFIIVRSGCLRLFYFNDTTDISVWFAFSESSAIEISSFISQKPSEYNLQAIEDSEVLYLSIEELNRLCETHPNMQIMMKKFWEDVVVTLINRFTALQRDSAEKRYNNLLGKPQYLQKIPQKYLASYIGVTPTSLSRIRKKIK